MTARALYITMMAVALATPCASVAQQPQDPSRQSTTVTDDETDAGAAARQSLPERVNDPDAAVSVVMPQALLDRLTGASQTKAEETRADDETEATDEEAEKPVRAKGTKTVGYRVQVYADNNARTAKGEARQRERVLGRAFPSYGTYVTYASPYWRLRVGDFRSQYDAEKAAAEIRKAFPSFAREVRVVRDRVNVR